MFGVGPGEFLIIIIVALLVLGPEKLPGAAKTFGRFMGQMRRMSTEFQRTLHSEMEPEEAKRAKPAPPNAAEETQRLPDGTAGYPDEAETEKFGEEPRNENGEGG